MVKLTFKLLVIPTTDCYFGTAIRGLGDTQSHCWQTVMSDEMRCVTWIKWRECRNSSSRAAAATLSSLPRQNRLFGMQQLQQKGHSANLFHEPLYSVSCHRTVLTRVQQPAWPSIREINPPLRLPNSTWENLWMVAAYAGGPADKRAGIFAKWKEGSIAKALFFGLGVCGSGWIGPNALIGTLTMLPDRRSFVAASFS